MGMVTDVLWRCPGCGTQQVAQTYGEWGDPGRFEKPSDVPLGADLKWNPPCDGCGKFQLVRPRLPLSVLPIVEADA